MQPGPIYLIGPSGNPNFGDEFIAASWLKYLARVRPGTDVWLDCPQPGTAQVLFEGLHPRLRVTNTLWRLVHETSELSTAEAAETIRERVTDLGSPSYDLGLLKLREAETLHLIGGGYVNDTWPAHAGLVVAMKAVQDMTGARLVATGQGLLPALSDPPAGHLFDGFTHAASRDEAGALACGIPHELDDAFLGVTAEIGRAPAEAGLYVCIQSDTVDPERFDKAVALARSAVQKAAADGVEAFYVEAIPGADRLAYESLADLIPEERFIPFVRIWSEGLPLSATQTWVTSRFHFHLLAAAAGAGGTAVGMKEGYYDVKHESVAALGSGWTLSFDEAENGHRDGLEGNKYAQEGEISGTGPNRLHQGLQALVDRKFAEARSIYPPVPVPARILNRAAEARRVLGASASGAFAEVRAGVARHAGASRKALDPNS